MIGQCQHCGASLAGKRTGAKWCSARCRVAGNRTARIEAGGFVELTYRANFLDLSERLLELGDLPPDRCENKDAVEEALGHFIERHLV